MEDIKIRLKCKNTSLDLMLTNHSTEPSLIWIDVGTQSILLKALDLIKAIQDTNPIITDPAFLIRNNKELIEIIRSQNDFGQPIWRCAVCDKANPVSLQNCTCGVGRQSDSKIFNKVKQ